MGEEVSLGGLRQLGRKSLSVGIPWDMFGNSVRMLRQRETHIFWFKGSRALEAPENFITKNTTTTICTAKEYTVLHTGE